MEKKDFDKEIKEARERVEGMDRVDGFKDRLPSTILSALKSGLKNPDNKSQYDAYIMLKDVVMEKKKWK